jgi:outer membrane protein assembly factor BamB
MNRLPKIALMCGLALTVASCGTIQRALPFGLGGDKEEVARATEGQRISILEFEQSLMPSAALSGRDFFLPGPQAATAWTQPGGNAENAVEHVIAGQELSIAWKRNIGAGSNRNRQVMAPVVADNGRLFVLDGESTVSAVDASTGSVVWKADVKVAVAVSGGKVFVSSGYRNVTALDANSGDVLWTTKVDLPIHGAPTVSGQRVFVVDVDNQLMAFNVNTGAQEWSYRGITEPARIMRASSPAVSGETIIAPFSSGELVALRASNGQPVWQEVLSRTSRTSALSEIRDIAGRPVISRGFVYAVSQSGVMQAMDIRTGQPRWSLPVAGVNAPLPVGDVVYVVSKAGELTVVNRESGQVYWTRNLNEGRERKEGGVFGIGSKIVRPVWSGPILASNRLVLVNSDGELVAFDPKTGAQQSTVKLGAAAYIAPAAYNGALVVLTDEGQLISIR